MAIDMLADFAYRNTIDLTIVGPEAPLAEGIVDLFNQRKLRCLGPTKAAARIESSKVFAKQLMNKNGVPTARHASFTDIQKARLYVQNHEFPLVIKADGLAAGKGVVIAQTKEQAYEALDQMMIQRIFGNAGQKIIIEEFMHGQELSFIVLTDGKHVLPQAICQEYKTRDDDDRGPNTGGMGAYSPVPIVTEQLEERIMETIIRPTIKGLADEGSPFTGFLYGNLMVTPNNEPKVIEFNCRMGDPEAQILMMRLQSDFVPLCLAAVDGDLITTSLTWDKRSAIGVVIAAGGYPGSYRKGDFITGLQQENNPLIKIFHAGTSLNNDKVLTSGGRVLCVTGLGNTTKEAYHHVYQVVDNITWKDSFYRTDIGVRAFGIKQV